MLRSRRAIGLDFGSRRIGVALSDDRGVVATPYEVIKRIGDRRVEHGRIEQIVAETGAVMVVAGLPRSLDGTDGHAAMLVGSELNALRRRLEVPVIEVDERFSTVTAAQSLRRAGMRAKRQREHIDAVAAAVILQSWLDAQD